MTEILTATLNPALDMATETPRVVAEGKLRCLAPRVDPGGGGANVSRALALLGGASRAWIAVGGPTGREYRERFSAEGIAACWFEAPGDTRRTLGVTERETGAQFRFLMPGADWTPAAGEAALNDVLACLGAGDWVVVSGSLPPGLATDWPRRLAEAAKGIGALAVLDTSGPALDAAAAAGTGAHVLRMDRAEAGGLIGVERPSPEQAEALARRLVASGAARIAVITLAEAGAVAASADAGVWRATPPAVEVTSATGAGDSFVAALVLALSRGQGLDEALAFAVAAAADAVTTPATALVTAAGVAEKLRATTTRRL